MEPLRFDESTHTYWLGQRKLVSVTQVLSDLGLTNNYAGISSFYAQRGVAVHKCCEYVDKGTLDDATVDPAIGGYVRAYRRFIKESGYAPYAWEVPLHHERLGFAGTLDKVGTLGGRFGVLDIKTSSGSLDPAVEPQLCAYTVLWNEHHPERPVDFKYALQLKDDGSYNLITKYSSTGVELWLSILDVYRWKLKRRNAA